MVVQFHQARRQKAKLRLALAGPAGSGKTYSALQIAFGLGGRIVLIDTERGSGELYSHLGNYDVCTLEAPFTPEKYTEAIKRAEEAGYDTIIIDSLSHAWGGPGGVLEIQGHAADKSDNSWTAWRQVTPRHNELVNSMLQTRCHLIATLRSKMGYLQTTEDGISSIRRVGMNPIQRPGIEYEFTVFLDLDQSHMALASKDRTSLLDGQVFKPSPELGQVLKQWLESGAEQTNNSAADRGSVTEPSINRGGAAVLPSNNPTTVLPNNSTMVLSTNPSFIPSLNPAAVPSTDPSTIPAIQSSNSESEAEFRIGPEPSSRERLELPAWMIDRAAGPAGYAQPAGSAGPAGPVESAGMTVGRGSRRQRVF